MDLTGHRSRLLTPALLGEADLVLVMEEAHRRSLFHLAPQHLSKVYLLTEMSGKHADVADPYGGPVEGYVRTADELERLIDAGMPMILQPVGGACCVNGRDYVMRDRKVRHASTIFT